MMDKAMRIFSAIGKAVIVDNEDLIDVVTAVSGSGPAYFFLMMEEMIRIAGDMGLPPEIAKILVLQTAKGTALLASERDKFSESPSELRRKVTSLAVRPRRPEGLRGKELSSIARRCADVRPQQKSTVVILIYSTPIASTGAFVSCLLHRIFVFRRNVLYFNFRLIDPISKTSGQVSQHSPQAVQVSSMLTFIPVSHIRFY